MKTKINAYDIAKAANVSAATVSRFMHHPEKIKNSTAERIQAAIDKFGYAHKDTKQNGQKRIILLNVPDITNIFYAEVIEGAKESAESNGYHLLVDQTALNASNILLFATLITKLHVFGVIILNQLPTYILNKIAKMTRVVQCCEYNPSAQLPFVSIDDYSAAKMASKQFLVSGKKQLAMINGNQDFKYAHERERGFCSAITEAGAKINPDWIVSLPVISYDLAYSTAVRLLNQKNHPDAFFCVSDTLGAGVVSAARKLKLKIPEDVAIIGFDNTIISNVISPSLTTINQPKWQEGYLAVDLLVNNYDREQLNNPDKQINLPVELIVREST
ncbi:MAG: LacI family DNA-binding transcriptional regulator [Oenococcus sp.]|uniref:LacI family DNA-binding transcriptional regulator n=1 Tax=Oenococcus TaxID=46254 RepID=UPI0021E91F06|nr:LacI family DNA-binding transcriptional regulator [Oenococcus kitaharae]MCV3296610.1 LacI family DNA-binding transcriptional regulator [Oenococcus kitaharae]